MTQNSETPAYRVSERDGNFDVINGSGNVVLTCGDEASAQNYAVLLAEAYQQGYKAGYREAKKLVTPRS